MKLHVTLFCLKMPKSNKDQYRTLKEKQAARRLEIVKQESRYSKFAFASWLKHTQWLTSENKKKACKCFDGFMCAYAFENSAHDIFITEMK